MTDFSSLTSSQPHEGGAAIRLPHNRQQVQRETCSTEGQAGQLLVQIPHQGCSHGPWPGLTPHPAQKTQKAVKASLGTFVVIARFLCSINKSEPLAVVPRSKTSPWTVQLKGPRDPRPHGTDTHTLWPDSSCVGGRWVGSNGAAGRWARGPLRDHTVRRTVGTRDVECVTEVPAVVSNFMTFKRINPRK